MIKHRFSQLFIQMSSSSQLSNSDSIKFSELFQSRREKVHKEGNKQIPKIYILAHKLHRTKVESEEVNVQNQLSLEKIKDELHRMRCETQELLERTEIYVTNLTDFDRERKYREFTGNWDKL